MALVIPSCMAFVERTLGEEDVLGFKHTPIFFDKEMPLKILAMLLRFERLANDKMPFDSFFDMHVSVCEQLAKESLLSSVYSGSNGLV